MEKSRLDQQFDFFREIDKEKFIGRQTYLSDAKRKENDAEHAWHMAIMTILLSEYANENIDVLDEEGKKTQHQRETLAADRIFGMLPDDQAKKMRALWEEFEANETAEAHFAHAMDNIQPIMLNAATDGKAWEEHSVHLQQILKRNQITPLGSEELWSYSFEHFIRPNVENGKIEQ